MDNQSNSPKPYYGEELEINLGDYVHIIWRRRKAVSVVFITIIILAIIVSFVLPKTYQSSSIINVAKIADQLVESPSAIVDVLKQESVLRDLTKKSGWPESKFLLLAKSFQVSAHDGVVEVSGTGSTPEKAKKIVDIIDEFIINRENNMAARFKPNLKVEIDLIQSDLDKNAASIADLEAKIDATSKSSSMAQGYIAASYIAARQTAKSRRDDLQKQLYDKQRELSFQSQEAGIDVPTVLSIQPIRPSKKTFVISAAILGLFISICYAFVQESIEKSKKRVN